jgi:hypothetical protein
MFFQVIPKIGKPATNALHHIGVKTLEDIAGYDRTTLLAIHANNVVLSYPAISSNVFTPIWCNAFVAGFPILGKS